MCSHVLFVCRVRAVAVRVHGRRVRVRFPARIPWVCRGASADPPGGDKTKIAALVPTAPATLSCQQSRVRASQNPADVNGEAPSGEQSPRDSSLRTGTDSASAVGNGDDRSEVEIAANRARNPRSKSEFEQLPACLAGYSENFVLATTACLVATALLSVVLLIVRANGDTILTEIPAEERYTGRYAGDPWWGRNYTPAAGSSGQ